MPSGGLGPKPDLLRRLSMVLCPVLQVYVSREKAFEVTVGSSLSGDLNLLPLLVFGGHATLRLSPPTNQAARAIIKNFSTAAFKWALSLDSERADCKTCVHAAPV